MVSWIDHFEKNIDEKMHELVDIDAVSIGAKNMT